MKKMDEIRIFKKNTIYFDINTSRKDPSKITQLGAVHAVSGQFFDEKIRFKTEAGKLLKSFFTWIREVNDGDPVVLIGHNAKAFDKNVFETVARKNKIKIPTRLIDGYSDSLIAFRENFKFENYDLDSLAKRFNQPPQTHDALDDSKLVKKLVGIALKRKRMKMDQFFGKAFRPNL